MTVAWTRDSDYILKVEPDAHLRDVMHIDGHVKGSLESCTREALLGQKTVHFMVWLNSATGSLFPQKLSRLSVSSP